MAKSFPEPSDTMLLICIRNQCSQHMRNAGKQVLMVSSVITPCVDLHRSRHIVIPRPPTSNASTCLASKNRGQLLVQSSEHKIDGVISLDASLHLCSLYAETKTTNIKMLTTKSTNMPAHYFQTFYPLEVIHHRHLISPTPPTPPRPQLAARACL